MLIGGGADSIFWSRRSRLQNPETPRCPARSVYSSQDALRRGQDAFKSALIASKMLIKRLSDAFNVEDAIWNQFGTSLGSDFGDPCIVISPFSTRIRFWTKFWTLGGSLLAAFSPPRCLKPLWKFILDRPRAVQDYFFSAPRVKKKEGSKQGSKF